MTTENLCKFTYAPKSICQSDGPFFLVNFGEDNCGSYIACRLHIIDLAPLNTTLTVTPYDLD